MTHETQNVACQHAIAARTALEAFRRRQAEAGSDWNSFNTAVGLLDQTIEELRRPVHRLQPILLAAGGFPAAMAYLIEEIQAADGPDMELCQHAIDAVVPPKWKRAAVRITQESLANACRDSKSKRIFLELTLDGNVLRIHARDWGSASNPTKQVPDASDWAELADDSSCSEAQRRSTVSRGKGRISTPRFRSLGKADRRGQIKLSPRMRFGEG